MDARHLFTLLVVLVAALTQVKANPVQRSTCTLGGIGSQCPLSGASLGGVCGCQAHLTCYVGPTGIQPMFGRCITEAEYKIEQQRLKDNPWLMMVPGVNPGKK